MARQRIADFGFRIRSKETTFCGFSLTVDVDKDETGRVDVDVHFEVEDGSEEKKD